jgi:AraC family transcriptional regulator
VDNDKFFHYLQLLSSFELGWDSLNLIYELEAANEMRKVELGWYFMSIAFGKFLII